MLDLFGLGLGAFGLVAAYLVGAWQNKRSDLGAFVDAALEQLAELHQLACLYWTNDWSVAATRSSRSQKSEEEAIRFKLTYLEIIIQTIGELSGGRDNKKIRNSADEVLKELHKVNTGGLFEVNNHKADPAKLAEVSKSARNIVVFLAELRTNEHRKTKKNRLF